MSCIANGFNINNDIDNKLRKSVESVAGASQVKATILAGYLNDNTEFLEFCKQNKKYDSNKSLAENNQNVVRSLLRRYYLQNHPDIAEMAAKRQAEELSGFSSATAKQVAIAHTATLINQMYYGSRVNGRNTIGKQDMITRVLDGMDKEMAKQIVVPLYKEHQTNVAHMELLSRYSYANEEVTKLAAKLKEKKAKKEDKTDEFKQLTKQWNAAKQERFNAMCAIVDELGNVRQKNYKNMVVQAKGNPNDWFTKAFQTSSLFGLVREFEKELKSDGLINENFQDDDDIANMDADSVDESSKSWEDKLWSSFTKSVSTDLKLYFNSIYKLRTPSDLGTSPNEYSYDTENELGVKTTMGANFVITALYTYGKFGNVKEFIDSIVTMSHNHPELYGLIDIANKAVSNPEFANFLFVNLANPRVEKLVVHLNKKNDTDGVKSAVSVEHTNKSGGGEVKSWLIFNMFDTIKSTMFDAFTEGDVNALQALKDRMKGKTNDNILGRGKSYVMPEEGTPDYEKRKKEVTKNIEQRAKEREGYVDAIYKVLKKYYPQINRDTISLALYSDTNNVVNNINTLCDNIIKLLNNINDIIIPYNETVSAYIKERKEYNKKVREAETIGEYYKGKSPEFDSAAVPYSKMNASIVAIANQLGDYVFVQGNLNTPNAELHLASDIIENSWITNLFRQIAFGTTEEANAGLERLLEEVAKGEQYKYNTLFWGIRDSRGKAITEGLFIRDASGRAKVNPEARNILKMSLFDGARDNEQRKGVMYDRMSKADYLLTSIYAFMNPVRFGDQYTIADTKFNFAGYFMRTPSDAPKNFIFQAPKYGTANLFKSDIPELNRYKDEFRNKINRLVASIEEETTPTRNKGTKKTVSSEDDALDALFDELISKDRQRAKSSNIRTISKEELFGLVNGSTDVISLRGLKKNKNGKWEIVYNIDGEKSKAITIELEGEIANENDYQVLDNPRISRIYSYTISDGLIAGYVTTNLGAYIEQEGIRTGKVHQHIERNAILFQALKQSLLGELNTYVDQLNNVFKQTADGRWVLRDDKTGLFDRAHYNGELMKNGKLTGNFFKFLRLYQIGDLNTQDLLEKALGIYSGDNALIETIDGVTELNLQNGLVSQRADKHQKNRLVLNQTQVVNDIISGITEQWLQAFNQDIASKYQLYETALSSQEITKEQFFDAMLNYAVMEMQMDDLFEGDVKFYKSANDFLKRAKEVQASGQAYAGFDINDSLSQPIHDTVNYFGNEQPITVAGLSLNDFIRARYKDAKDGEYITSDNARNGFRAITITNTVRPSKFANQIYNEVYEIAKAEVGEQQAAKIAEQIASGFRADTKTNDAQSYITLEEFIRRRYADGTLNQYQGLLQEILAVRKGEKKASELNLAKINARIQVQKNFYFDKHFDKETQTYYPRQIKNAEFVLIPELLEGTELVQLYDVMMKYDIGQVNTAETAKAAKKNVLTFWDNDGNINPNFEQELLANDKASIEDFYYRYLYKQQEVHDHMRNAENKAGTQIMRRIFDNASPEIAQHVAKLMDNYCANIKQSFNQLVFSMGWGFDREGRLVNIEHPDQSLDFTEFYRRARYESQRLGLNTNYLDYLTPDELGNPLMPNYMSNVAVKLESLAQSIFTSNITRQTLPGWHAAQVTQVGIGTKVLDSNGKLRELKYHPAVMKGQKKRYATKINNNDYEQTNEFRELQERSRKRTDAEIQQSHQDEKLDEGIREHLRFVFRAQLESARDSNGISDGILSAGNRLGTQYTIRKNVSGKLFHDLFEIARSYLPNGELVDLHDNYDDCICYLSEDGTSGFAIEQKTGNLVSVFNLGVRKGFLISIRDYIRKEGATHLDAYASNKQNLAAIYEKTIGAKIASAMDYNMEYDHDYIAKNHGNPQVVFMVFGDDIDSRNIETKYFNKDQYDEAEAYANSYNTEQAAYAEIMIPRWSDAIPKDYDISKLEKEGLDIHLAYRIPTEGKQSVSVVKVVGFLDDVYGSTIVVPDEWVTQTGSDFDIDTVYAICYELKKFVNPKTKEVTIRKWKNDPKNGDSLNYMEYLKENINSKLYDDPVTDPLHSNKWRTLADELEKLRKTFNSNNGQFDYAALNRIGKSAGLMSFNEFKDLPEVEKLPRQERNNNILDAMIAIMQHPTTREENYSRSNFDDITAAMQEMDEARGAMKLARSTYNPFDQLDFMENATNGMSLKAFSVSRDSFNSLNNRAGSRLSTNVIVEYQIDEGYDIDTIINAYGLYDSITGTGDVVLIDRNGKQTTDKAQAYKIRVRHNRLANSNNNRNVVGRLITPYSSETTAHILDAIKEGTIYNESQYTFGTFKTLIDLGIDYRTAIAFLMQPAITRVNDANNETNSLYITNKGDAIVKTINRLASELGVKTEKGELIADNTRLSDTIKALSLNEEIRGILQNTLGLKFEEDQLITELNFALNTSLLKWRLQQDETSMEDPKVLAVFDLMIALEFNKFHDATQSIEKVMWCTNPESFGAKQTIRSARRIIENIVEYSKETSIIGNEVTVNGRPLLSVLYPDISSKSGINIEKSVYPFLASFMKYATKASVDVNQKLFPTENDTYSKITNMAQSKMGCIFNDEQYLVYKQYMMSHLYSGIPYISTPLTITEEGWITPDANAITEIADNGKNYWNAEVARVFGYTETQSMNIQIEDINNPTEEEIRQFNKLTPAQKALWIQQNIEGNKGIFEFLSINKFNQWQYRQKGYSQQTIRVIDNDSINVEELFNAFNISFFSKNPLVRLAAVDLVKYAFIVDGFRFKRGSLAKVITNTAMSQNVEDMGMNLISVIRQAFQHYADPKDGATNAFIDRFIRSHSECVKTIYLRYPRTTNGVMTNGALFNTFNQNANGLVFIPFQDRAESLLRYINYGEKDAIETPQGYIRISKNLGKNRTELTLYKIVKVPNKGLYLIPLNLLEANETGDVSVNPANNKFKTLQYYQEIINAAEEQNSTVRQLNDNKKLTIKESEYAISRFNFQQVKEIDENVNELQTLLEHGTERQKGEIGKFVEQINTWESEDIENKDSNMVYVISNSKYLNTQIPMGKSVVQTIQLDNGTSITVEIKRVKAPKKFAESIQKGDRIDNSRIPISQRNAYDIAFKGHIANANYYLVKPVTNESVANEIDQQDRDKNDERAPQINAITNDIEDIMDSDSLEDPFGAIDSAAKALINSLNRAMRHGDKNAMTARSKIRELGINENSARDFSENRESIYKIMTDYLEIASDTIMNAMNHYVLDGEEYNIASDDFFKALRDAPEEVEPVIRLMLDAVTFGNDFGEIMSLPFDGIDEETTKAITKIRNAVAKVRNNDIIKRAFRQMFNNYLANEFSTNPNVRLGLVNLSDTFGDVSWFDSWIGDIHQLGNKEIQAVLKLVESILTKARNDDAPARKREFLKRFDAIDKESGEFDWEKVINKQGMLVQEFTPEFREKRRELRDKVSNAKEQYGADSIEYWNAVLERDEWFAKNVEQPIVKDYYDQKNQMLRSVLENAPDEFVEYMKLSHELYSEDSYLDLSPEEALRKRILTKNKRALLLAGYNENYEYIDNEEVQRKWKAVKEYVDSKRALDGEYLDQTELDGFKEELDKNLDIIQEYEKKHPDQTIDERLANQKYNDAYNWIKENATYIVDEETNNALQEAMDFLYTEDDNGVIDEKEWKTRKFQIQKIIDDANAYDKFGNVDPRKLTTEQVKQIKEITEGAKKNKATRLIKDIPQDKPMGTDEYYEKVKAMFGDKERNEDIERARILNDINAILIRCIDDNGHISAQKMFTTLSFDERNQLSSLYAQLRKYDSDNGAEGEQEGESFTEKASNTDQFTIEYNWAKDNLSKQEFNQFLKIFCRVSKRGNVRKRVVIQDQETGEGSKLPPYIENNYIYGYSVPSGQYQDANRTASRKLLLDNVEYIPTDYYYAAAKKARQEGKYDEWFEANHIFNHATNKYEPLRIWTMRHINPNGSLHGTYHYQGTFENSERDVKEEYVNSKYKTTGENYNRNGDYTNSAIYQLSAKEDHMRELLQEAMDFFAENGGNKEFIRQGYVPRKRKIITDKAWYARQALGLAGLEYRNDSNDKYYDKVDYENDIQIGHSMLGFLNGKGSEQEEQARPQGIYESNEDYQNYLDALEARNEEIRAKNLEIDNALMSRDFRTVFAEAIQEQVIIDAKEKAKSWLYLLQEELKQNPYYKVSAMTNKLVPNKRESVDAAQKYVQLPQERALAAVDNFVRRVIYDQFKEKTPLNKYADLLRNITSAKYMIFNLTGGIANVGTGFVNILGESFAQDNITNRELIESVQMYLSNSLYMIKDMYKDSSDNFATTLTKYFDVVDFDAMMERVPGETSAEYVKRIHNLSYGLQSGGEHFMQNSVLFAVLKQSKIFDDVDGTKRCGTFSQYTWKIEYDTLMSVIKDDQERKDLLRAMIYNIRTDLQEAYKYDSFRRDFVEDFLRAHCTQDQINEYIAKRDENMKKAKEEWKSKPSAMEQLELDDEGRIKIKDGSEFTDQMKYELRNTAIALNKKIHGVYDKIGAARIEFYWWGGLVMQYHKHIYPGMMKRYRRKGYYNEFTNTVEIGSYVALADLLSKEFRGIGDRIKGRVNDGENAAIASIQEVAKTALNSIINMRTNWNLMPQWERNACKRCIGDAMGIVSAILLGMAIYALTDDDDEKESEFIATALYISDRLLMEAQMYTPWGIPTEANTLYSSPIAGTNGPEDLMKALSYAGQWMFNKEFNPKYTTGLYKGQNKEWVLLKRNIPFYRVIDRLNNMTKNNSYYRINETSMNMRLSKAIADKINPD